MCKLLFWEIIDEKLQGEGLKPFVKYLETLGKNCGFLTTFLLCWYYEYCLNICMICVQWPPLGLQICGCWPEVDLCMKSQIGLQNGGCWRFVFSEGCKFKF